MNDRKNDQNADQLTETELAEVQGGFVAGVYYLATPGALMRDVMTVNKEVKKPSTITKILGVTKLLGLW